MRSDLAPLFALAIIGLVAAGASALFVPFGLVFGLAWLLDPRLGEVVWTVAYAVSGLWAVLFTVMVTLTLLSARHK